MSPSASTRVEWARRLASSIVSDGYATDADVAPVLAEATDRGSSFPALLISRDVTSQEVVLGLLSQLTRLPVVDLDRDRPSDQALAATPLTAAHEYGAVGYRLDGDQLTTAFGDPPDEDDVARAIGARRTCRGAGARQSTRDRARVELHRATAGSSRTRARSHQRQRARARPRCTGFQRIDERRRVDARHPEPRGGSRDRTAPR